MSICYVISVSLCTFLSTLFLQYEYFNAVLINEVDEEGNSVELGGEFILQPNDHFNNLSVNLSLSVVQVPTNMYNKGMLTASNVKCTKYVFKHLISSMYNNNNKNLT